MPTLCKQERLFEKRLLSVLFDKGRRFNCSDSGELRVCYLLVDRKEVWENDEVSINVKMMVNAPKSRYKHAVDRNRIKRLLREAYRFHKTSFVDLVPQEKVLLISFQFTSGEVSLPVMRRLMEKTTQMLQNRLGHA